MNFEENLKLEIQSSISKYGVKIPTKNINEMLLDFLTIHKKIIPQIPRPVLISNQLNNKLFGHSKHKEIYAIREMFIRGSNINIFQSKKLFQTKFHDHLLYEWDIFHLHLSTKLEKDKKFVKQTNDMLFVYIDQHRAIFLDTETHKPGIFADDKWIEILHYNFPDVLAPYIVKGVSDISHKLNSIDKQTIWDKGITTGMTKIENTIYFSKGVGRMTSGHSTIVSMQVNNIMRWLFSIKDNFDNHFDDICNDFGIQKSLAKFKIIIGEETFEIIDENTNQKILTFPQFFNFDKFKSSC